MAMVILGDLLTFDGAELACAPDPPQLRFKRGQAELVRTVVHSDSIAAD